MIIIEVTYEKRTKSINYELVSTKNTIRLVVIIELANDTEFFCHIIHLISHSRRN